MMDLNFCDTLGTWQHCSYPIETLSDLPVPSPLDKNIYALEGEELAAIPKVPGSQAESIYALESDHAILVKGVVFADELVQSWISWKRNKEIDPLALRPHPYEFHLYYDC